MKTEYHQVLTKNGKIRNVQALTFSHVVQGETFEFLVHESTTAGKPVVVTHKESGAKVCEVPLLLKAYPTLEEVLEAATAALTATITKHGEARCRSVLAGAKSLRSLKCPI